MHDVGKIGVPDNILQKPGPLTCEERAQMQTHPRIGYDILHDPCGSKLTDMAAEISLGHHEKWDGTGYGEHHGNQGHQGHQCRKGQRRTRLHHVFAKESTHNTERPSGMANGLTGSGALLHGAV